MYSHRGDDIKDEEARSQLKWIKVIIKYGLMLELTVVSRCFSKTSRKRVMAGSPSKSLKWLLTHSSTILVTCWDTMGALFSWDTRLHSCCNLFSILQFFRCLRPALRRALLTQCLYCWWMGQRWLNILRSTGAGRSSVYCSKTLNTCAEICMHAFKV